MVPFPSEFPREEVGILLPLLRGQIPSDKREAARAAWVLVGYGTGSVIPAPAVVEGFAAPALSVEDCCSMLESMDMKGFSSIPWQVLLRTIWPILQKLIEDALNG